MRKSDWLIEQVEQIAPSVYRMVLRGNTADIYPGQFVNLSIPGLYLRRPISVCDVEGDCLMLVFKVVGAGTRVMAEMQKGTRLNVLTGLGNGYDMQRAGDEPLLLGGGVGVPPMYYLAKKLREMGKEVHVVLGFNTQSEVFYESEFRALGCDVKVATADGSYGVKGFVTNALPLQYSYFFACGPLPMLRAVESATLTDGELSYEERMGCGFGACVGCTAKTRSGYQRVCKEGPVFRKGQWIYE